MGKRGPNKKPTALKAIEGNRGKKPLPQNEPKPPPVVEMPDPPEWMSSEGKKMWEKRAPMLQRLGLLTEADLESFTMLCQSYAEWVEAVKYIKKHGKYYTYTNKAGAKNQIERPANKLLDKAYQRYKSMCTEFGMTPSSKSGIEIEKEQEKDEMELLLSK